MIINGFRQEKTGEIYQYCPLILNPNTNLLLWKPTQRTVEEQEDNLSKENCAEILKHNFWIVEFVDKNGSQYLIIDEKTAKKVGRLLWKSK